MTAILGTVSTRRTTVASADRATRHTRPRRPSRTPAVPRQATAPGRPGADGAAPATGEMSLEIITFGFKYGLPTRADLVFDVRFLTNPFWVPDLKPLSGLSAPVRRYVLGQPQAGRFLDLVVQLLELTVPAYQAAGRSRLTVALGCTGGFHRSIALAEELAGRLGGLEGVTVSVSHRELRR